MPVYADRGEAVQACLENKRFAVASILQKAPSPQIHLHDCLTLYYSRSVGRQFGASAHLYPLEPGDLFAINAFDVHNCVPFFGVPVQLMMICVRPDFLIRRSTPQTDLTACFAPRKAGFAHRRHLALAERTLAEGLLGEIEGAQGYGADLLQELRLTELMLLASAVFAQEAAPAPQYPPARLETRAWINRMLAYLDEHITSPLSLEGLAQVFDVSAGTLCRVFKEETSTTLIKYIAARRIALAKELLAGGYSVQAACTASGFNDYSHFIRVFGKQVGHSPKQYALQQAVPSY